MFGTREEPLWLLAEKQNTGIADLLLAAGSLAGASAMAQETVADSVLNLT